LDRVRTVFYENKPNGSRVKLLGKTNTAKTLANMKSFSKEFSKDKFIKARAKDLLEFYHPVKGVFDYVYNSAVFKEEFGIQNLKRPSRLMTQRTANCVQYSTFISALLTAMNIPHYFRAIDDGVGHFNHVYIVTFNGIVLDCVIGQPKGKKATFLNRPKKGQYNSEVSYYEKIDLMAELYLLNGINDYNGKSINMNGCGCSGCGGNVINGAGIPMELLIPLTGIATNITDDLFNCHNTCSFLHPFSADSKAACQDDCNKEAPKPPASEHKHWIEGIPNWVVVGSGLIVVGGIFYYTTRKKNG